MLIDLNLNFKKIAITWQKSTTLPPTPSYKRNARSATTQTMPAFSEYRLQSKYSVLHYEIFLNTLRFEAYLNQKSTILSQKLTFFSLLHSSIGWFKNPVSSQTEKLMACTKFSDYLGINHYKKSNKNKTFHPFKVGPPASKFWFITIVYHQQ